MSTTIPAEASKPPKKMQECKRRMQGSGYPNQLIGFDKVGDDPEDWKNKIPAN